MVFVVSLAEDGILLLAGGRLRPKFRWVIFAMICNKYIGWLRACLVFTLDQTIVDYVYVDYTSDIFPAISDQRAPNQ